MPRGAARAHQKKGMDFLLCLATAARSTVYIKSVLLKEKIVICRTSVSCSIEITIIHHEDFKYSNLTHQESEVTAFG